MGPIAKKPEPVTRSFFESELQAQGIAILEDMIVDSSGLSRLVDDYSSSRVPNHRLLIAAFAGRVLFATAKFLPF